MLIRLVRMTFHPDAIDRFLILFDATAPKIRDFPGCRHLELWQDERYASILTTYSHWADADALDGYRRSEFFKETWARTKPLFAAPPEAFSQHILRSATRTRDAGLRLT